MSHDDMWPIKRPGLSALMPVYAIDIDIDRTHRQTLRLTEQSPCTLLLLCPALRHDHSKVFLDSLSKLELAFTMCTLVSMSALTSVGM